MPTGATPALAEGTGGIELAGRAEKATDAKPEALEPGTYSKAGRRRETPLQGEVRCDVNTPPRELDVLPPEDRHKPEALPRKGERESTRRRRRGQSTGLGTRRCDRAGANLRHRHEWTRQRGDWTR